MSDENDYLDALDAPRSGYETDYYCPSCQFYFLDKMYYSGNYSCPVCACEFDANEIEQ